MRRLQLWGMDLTEVPSELFRMKNLKILSLFNNNICSLPSDIAQLTTLEKLEVRLSIFEAIWRDLNRHVVFRSPATSSRLFRPSSVY
jgi:hypothetical protein